MKRGLDWWNQFRAHVVLQHRMGASSIHSAACRWTVRATGVFMKQLGLLKYVARIAEMEPVVEKVMLERDTAKGMVKKLKLVSVELTRDVDETYRTYREARSGVSNTDEDVANNSATSKNRALSRLQDERPATVR